MKKTSIKNKIFLVVIALLFAAQSGFGQNVADRSSWQAIDAKFPKSLNMDHSLYKLWQVYKAYGLEKVTEYARYQGNISLEHNRVRVMVKSTPNSSTMQTGPVRHEVAFRIHAMGGVVELKHNQVYQSLVPISSLPDLANLPQVAQLRLPIKAQPMVVSEGVNFSGADKLQPLIPFRPGRTAKVGVLDFGFLGYQNLKGTELPADTVARSFRQDGDITGGGESHGTACAEVIHDMAPNAKLYLANYDTLFEIEAAIDWFADQGVNILNFSVGYYNAGPGDGTGWMDELVKYARAKGIFWVNAAGNDGLTHWEGSFSDQDKNGFMDFGGDDIFQFTRPANKPLWVRMNWNDWGVWDGTNYPGPASDYDLYLYIFNKNTQQWQLVDSSKNAQQGKSGQYPVEDIGGWYSTEPATWGIKVKRNAGAAVKEIEIFFEFNYSINLEFSTPQGSLTIPADSAQVIAVGAIPWETEGSIYLSSSRGPTSDDRIKPDLAAASWVSSQTYGLFGGTSASAPHVAGAMALLYNKTPFSMEQIVELLFARADDWGPRGKDNIIGFGKLDLVE